MVEKSISYEFPTDKLGPEILAKFLAQKVLDLKYCNPVEFNQLYIAFTEILINAVEHGNLELDSRLKKDDFREEQYIILKEKRLKDPKYANRKIYIKFKIWSEYCSLSVEDEGPGFNYRQIIDNINNIEASAEVYGRGFMYLSYLMDEFYFNEKGNKITVIKHFSDKV